MRRKTKGRICSSAYPSILSEYGIGPGQVVVLGKAVALELADSLALLPAQCMPGLWRASSSATALVEKLGCVEEVAFPSSSSYLAVLSFYPSSRSSKPYSSQLSLLSLPPWLSALPLFPGKRGQFLA